jgi:intraflagellar transport protein 88
MGDLAQALEWMNVLISVVPTDPNLLARLGDMFARYGDRSQAFQYYSESFRYYSSSLPVLTWLGTYHVEGESYEAAIPFFERAGQVEPGSKWPLMVASCHRRAGAYKQAYEAYKALHEQAPENVECLKFLVKMSTDLGMRDVGPEYARRLERLLQVAGKKQDAPAGEAPEEWSTGPQAGYKAGGSRVWGWGDSMGCGRCLSVR